MMNDKEKTSYEVEEISNGFILTKTTMSKDKDGMYKHVCEKTYFKENPLDDSVINKTDKMKKALGQTDEDGDEVVA